MAKGFLNIKCEKCGHIGQYYSKEQIESHVCRNCGHKTPLLYDDLLPIYLNCECGTRTTVFRTNRKEKMFDVQCIDCRQFVAVEYLPKKKHYVTINAYGKKVGER